MSTYELFLVLPGTLTEAEAAARAGELTGLVKEQTGSGELHALGKNRLAYPIKQIRYGYFYTVVFDCEPQALRAVTEKLRFSRDLLRVMVTHFTTNLTTAQQIAYRADPMGLTTVVEKELVRPGLTPRAPVAPPLAAAAVAGARGSEELNLEEINKKLDDLMSGEVIPTV